MLPTTTANFADLLLRPSKLTIAALSLLYLCAAMFLLLAVLRSSIPFIAAVIIIECLWLEWLQLWQYSFRHQGRISITVSGQVTWQRQSWQIIQIKVITRFFILLKVKQAAQQRWLLICHDACDDKDFRTLSLLCRNADFHSP
ncbi:protein YgfX [Photobacterium sp.]|uniref:protein YgfX n=1 Tax=Photobacterium sp. TaxID=660 RepID=UPI00299E5DBE|nr:protein YgfX [Photobacterium sp.]